MSARSIWNPPARHLALPALRLDAAVSRRGFLGGAAAVTAMLALAACSSSSSSKSGASSASDTLRVVAPDSAIGWAMDNGAYGEVQMNTQATLIRKPYVKGGTDTAEIQDINNFEGVLAESYSVSADGLVYTFKLRDAVSHAGNHLTADDVIWSYKRKFNSPKSVSPSLMTPQITSVDQFKAVDAHTLSITLTNPGYGLTMLALLSDLTGQIYDSTLLKQHLTADDPYAVAWSANNPNYGFGAYTVKTYTPGVQVTLAADPNYVLGEPKIKTVSVKIVPDAGTRANAVKSGDADLAENLLPADQADLGKASNVVVPTVKTPNAYLMIPLVTNKAPFDNIAVRQAFAYAVPYQQIIDNVYFGLATRTSPSFLLSSAKGYDGSGFTDFDYDPAKAKTMLAAAGFKDGVSFTLTVSSVDPDTQKAAVQIQTFAKDAGFTVNIDQQPAAAIAAGRAQGTFQAWVLRDWAITLTPSYELGVYTAKDGGNNLAKWNDNDFYAARAAGDALADPLSDEAGKAWNAAERYLVNDAPIVFIAHIQPGQAFTSKLKGFAWRSDQYVDYTVLSY
jgi:peptide/nickel transport system substrate-binding protein